jgi:DNA-directed RNA polymerase specialized sigma24 family protein
VECLEAAGGERLAALQASFAALHGQMRGRVEAVIRRARVEDPEASAAEVWAKAWQAYPRMVAAEEARRASGAAGHNWGGWFVMLARNVVRSEKRRAKVFRRVYGVQALARREDGDGGPALRCVGVDEVEDRAGRADSGDPAGVYERREQAARVCRAVALLPGAERAVIGRLTAGEGAAAAGRALGLAPGVIRRVRASAVGRLRAAL